MEKIIKLLSIVGVLIGLFVIYNAGAGLVTFLFLVHPVGDTLAAISWSNWLINIALVILMIVIGILCCIDFYKTYFSRSVEIIKNNKRLIFSGCILSMLGIYVASGFFLSPSAFFMGLADSRLTLLDFFKMLFTKDPIFISGIIIIFISLFVSNYNRSKYQKEINIKEQKIFNKKLKYLIIITIILLTGSIIPKLHRAINIRTDNTINPIKGLEAINKGRDSRIISCIAQARTVMHQVYLADNNYDNFIYSNHDIDLLCREIADNYFVKHPTGEVNPVIAILPASASTDACIYSLLNAKENYWYCADSAGHAGFYNGLENNPAITCRIDGTSAYCPSSEDETTGWETYKNEEYGFEFKYPENWGKIIPDQADTDEEIGVDWKKSIFEAQIKTGVYTFFSENKNIKKIWYQPSSRSLAFVEYTGHEEPAVGGGQEMLEQETLKIIGSKDKIIRIYTVPENKVAWYVKIYAVRFSPDNNYICFGLAGWEWRKPMIVNVQTKKNILEDTSTGFGVEGIYQDIFWSQNSKNLIISNHFEAFGGEGREEILISDYGKSEKLNQVFTLGKDFNLWDSKIYNVRLTDDEKLYFSVRFVPLKGETYEKEYEYLVKTKELKEIK